MPRQPVRFLLSAMLAESQVCGVNNVALATPDLATMGDQLGDDSTRRDTRPWIRFCLTELVGADLLDARGEKRGRYYVPSGRMMVVAREVSDSVGSKLSLGANPYEMAPT